MDFLSNITDYLTIGNTETQISMVTFSNETVERWDLNDHLTKSSLLSEISNLKTIITPCCGTKTYDALDYVTNTLLTTGKGLRTNVNTTVVVLTDGKSDNLLLTQVLQHIVFLM